MKFCFHLSFHVFIARLMMMRSNRLGFVCCCCWCCCYSVLEYQKAVDCSRYVFDCIANAESFLHTIQEKELSNQPYNWNHSIGIDTCAFEMLCVFVGHSTACARARTHLLSNSTHNGNNCDESQFTIHRFGPMCGYVWREWNWKQSHNSTKS